VNHVDGEELDDLAGVAVIGDRKRPGNREQINVVDRAIGVKQRNGSADRLRKSTADDVMIGIDRLAESVL